MNKPEKLLELLHKVKQMQLAAKLHPHAEVYDDGTGCIVYDQRYCSYIGSSELEALAKFCKANRCTFNIILEHKDDEGVQATINIYPPR